MSILLLQAEQDKLVCNRAQATFASLVNGKAGGEISDRERKSAGAGAGEGAGEGDAPRDASVVQVVNFPGAYHELLNETDPIRNRAIDLIVQHLLWEDDGDSSEEYGGSAGEGGGAGEGGSASTRSTSTRKRKQWEGQHLPETHPTSPTGMLRALLRWWSSWTTALWGGWRWLQLPPLLVVFLVLATLLVLLLTQVEAPFEALFGIGGSWWEAPVEALFGVGAASGVMNAL
jgi:hypothetical protein